MIKSWCTWLSLEVDLLGWTRALDLRPSDEREHATYCLPDPAVVRDGLEQVALEGMCDVDPDELGPLGLVRNFDVLVGLDLRDGPVWAIEKVRPVPPELGVGQHLQPHPSGEKVGGVDLACDVVPVLGVGEL